jgi:thioredoxin 1
MKSLKKHKISFNNISPRSACFICVVVLLITITPKTLFAQKNYGSIMDSFSHNKKVEKITFIELGSVRCIPCKKMQPVIRSIEHKYWNQVIVVFHDVYTYAGKIAAKKFTFNDIPTQIFLDKNGKKYFRHEGFLPEAEIVKILKIKGVK